MTESSRWIVAACISGAVAAVCPAHASGQWQAHTGPATAGMGATVGGDVERYLRAMTMAGLTRPLPWAARPFSAKDVADFVSDSTAGAHPWRAMLRRAAPRGASLGAVVLTSANSGFPWGSNDGPLWQGRGVTGAVGLSMTLRWRGLSAVAAPIAFSAQNASFPLMPQQAFGISPYADPLFPTVVDLPQRMGDGAYFRVDPGESTVRLDAFGLATGITTGSVGWGTGEAFPTILGANAGGFPRLFVGTRAGGLRIPYLGRVTGQYIFGVLAQSPWSSVKGSETYVDQSQSGTRRIGTGLSVSVMPAFFQNLELGVSRFYHSPYRTGANRWDAWSKPFEGLYKKGFQGRSGGSGDPTGDADNQMAAFFARWIFPRRGVEATFELFREDHNWDERDFAQEPENNAAVHASVRAVTSRSATAMGVVTLEYFDGDIRPIAQARAQGFLYTHAGLQQGHTSRGQLLGSPLGAGAITGQRVGWERFTATGSHSAMLQRWRTRGARTLDPEGLSRAVSYLRPNSHDWILDGSVASTRFTGTRALSLEGGVAWAGRWQFDASRTNFYARASWSLF